MKEGKEIFSTKQKQLLTIATWAKYLAWVVLVVYVLWAIGSYFSEQNTFLYYRSFGQLTPSQNYRDFLALLIDVPSFGFSVVMQILGLLTKGIIWFLVLKGISLGLNMIAETDINYRERTVAEASHEQ